MRFPRALAPACALALLAGCAHADFDVAVGNRTVNAIEAYANGSLIGEVGAGRTASFRIELRTLNSSGGFLTPSSQAQVAFSARDKITGKLSREKPMFLTQDRPVYVEFNAWDFVF